MSTRGGHGLRPGRGSRYPSGMHTEVHGHDVLRMIDSARPRLTATALEAEVARQWGADVRFHTCSTGGLTLSQLVDFLASRGKIVERDGFLAVEAGRVCGAES